ncbi:MAG: sigma-70 family RNA polymerase sigma factor [Candidatus Riflebacteria bacterium]
MNRSSDSQKVDSAFVADLRRQDSAAFKKLFDEMAEFVFRRALLFLGDESVAEDAVQEVFYKVWLKLPVLADGNLRGWISTITRNHCLDELRKRKRRPVIKENVDCQNLCLMVSPGEDLSDLEILAKLPEDIKIPIVLRIVDDLSYKEISEILDKPEGSLRNLVCRGMKILRKELVNDHEL